MNHSSLFEPATLGRYALKSRIVLPVDGTAVRAALIQPWSSGQTEGQITRLKLLKRQSYGHAGFDLLRRRVLLAA